VQIDSIHHVGLLVRDLEATVPFYTDVLGLHRRDDRPAFDVEGVWFDIGDGQQLHLFEGETPTDAGQHVALRVRDLNDAVGRLREHDVKVWLYPREGPYRQAVVRDPSGNRIELYVD
jgi:lactoylglutathione lyase